MPFSIGKHAIGSGQPFLIAEVAQAHDGSLGLAHSFIDAAARAGADAVKFQTHIASAESTLDESFRVKFSRQDGTRYEYWKRMEFSAEEWAELAKHATDRGLVFLSSAFSIAAVEILYRIGMPAWKVASGELTSQAILDAMIKAGGPFLVSTGMGTWVEIDGLAQRLRDAKREFAMLQCTSEYPTSLDHVGLNVIDEMRARYAVPVGLSDHSGRTAPTLAALARGAEIIETHITFDRGMFGPDGPASLTIDEFRAIADFRDALMEMDSHPVNKDKMAASLEPMRSLFGRSVAPSRTLAAGTVLTADMLVAKKPNTGIPESELSRLIGRKLLRDVPAERLITWTDLEPDYGKA